MKLVEKIKQVTERFLTSTVNVTHTSHVTYTVKINGKTTKEEEETLFVDGMRVDPKSDEGQKVIKKLKKDSDKRDKAWDKMDEAFEKMDEAFEAADRVFDEI